MGGSNGPRICDYREPALLGSVVQVRRRSFQTAAEGVLWPEKLMGTDSRVCRFTKDTKLYINRG